MTRAEAKRKLSAIAKRRAGRLSAGGAAALVESPRRAYALVRGRRGAWRVVRVPLAECAGQPNIKIL